VKHTVCILQVLLSLSSNSAIHKNDSIFVSDLWTNDLINVGYEDVPAIRETLDVHYPCVGQNALVGVYFYPSVIEAKLRTSALSKVFFYVDNVSFFCLVDSILGNSAS
jgi:hypothetical protein